MGTDLLDEFDWEGTALGDDSPHLPPLCGDEELEETKADELEKLRSYGVYEVVDKAVPKGKLNVSTRWEIGWSATKNKVRARFVAWEYKRLQLRFDLFAPRSSHDTSRLVDFVCFQLVLEPFTFDLVNAFFNVPESEYVYVTPPAEFVAQWHALDNVGETMWRLCK